MKELIAKLKEKNVGRIIENVPLRNYTTYKVGGVASAMVFPKTTEQLIEIIRLCRAKRKKHMVLGYGSNTLFSDRPYEGIIIKLDEMNHLPIERNKVTVGAGYSLMKLALVTAKKSLSGLEFAAGIPGTVGGAIYMNAGAYKSDMGYIVTKVKVLTDDYKVISMVNRECDFHYRSSFFQKHKKYIILEATMKLRSGDRATIDAILKERKQRRMESQPLEYPSAGSVFRNPEGMFAGKMIEDLGLKGLTKGGAQVSNKHANFIINIKDAKSQDIMDLIIFVRDTVLENYGVKLRVEQEFVNWE